MRTTQHIHVSILVSVMTAMYFTSSCKNDDVINTTPSDILNKYIEYREETSHTILETLTALDDNALYARQSLDISGSTLIAYISQMTFEKTDSLLQLYCTHEDSEKYDQMYASAIETLITYTSEQEYLHLMNFIEAYNEEGGNNLKLIENAINGVSPIISNCIIKCATCIDEFPNPNIHSRDANSWCLHELCR